MPPLNRYSERRPSQMASRPRGIDGRGLYLSVVECMFESCRRVRLRR